MAALWKWLLGWELGEVAHSDWRLRFVAEYPNWIKLVLMAVLAALVYLTVRSYRREGEAPRRGKAVLGAIRIAVIVLVMAILLQPAFMLRSVKSLTSSVVVLWDDSQSMGFKDRYSDPNVAELRQRHIKLLGRDAGNLTGLARTDIARRELLAPLAWLAAEHPLKIYKFPATQPSGSAGDTREMGTVDKVQSEGFVGAPPGAEEEIEKLLSGLTTLGYSSNQAGGVRGALDMTQGQRISAVVVVSDFQPTGQGAASGISGAMEYAQERGVQVFPVIVGDPTPPRNISVTALQAPREVRPGAEVEFTVTLSQRNMGGQNVNIKLQRRKQKEEKWDTDVLTQAAAIDRPGADANMAARSLQAVVLRNKPDELGDFEYRAVVEAGKDEVNPSESYAITPVRVVEEKIRVLLVSGDAGKEFQYLRNYFLRAQDDYLLSVWQQNADANVNQSASTGMLLNNLPKELDELIGVPGDKSKPGYNVVILYDPQHTEGGFDKHFVEDLLKPFVQKHHGGLCYIAGSKYTDSVLGNDQAFEALREMMAVTIAPDSINELARISETKPEPWQLRMTQYGYDHPITRLGSAADDSQQLWSDLPGIYWSHPVAKPKPGARVLAISGDPMRRLATRNDALPLIAVQPYGRGSVLYIGFDESWRWMPVNDGFYYRNFWGNVVRYLSSLQARRVTITAGGARFTIGERLSIEVEAYDESYQPVKKDSVDVIMTDAATGETAKKLTLKPVEDKPGQFKATLVAERTGKFQLTADLPSGDPNSSEEAKVIEIEQPQAEFLRTEADPATARIMAMPQDKFMDSTQAGRLSEIPSGRWTSVLEVPKYLWDTNLMLAMIVVLLGVEWILRKKYNMA